jgi:hypothetical protein
MNMNASFQSDDTQFFCKLAFSPPLRKTSDSSLFMRILIIQPKCFLVIKSINNSVGNPERKKQLGRYRRRWEDVIKRNFKEIGSEGVNWIQLAQNGDRCCALVNTVINLRVA